jgi:hypothetical protein
LFGFFSLSFSFSVFELHLSVFFLSLVSSLVGIREKEKKMNVSHEIELLKEEIKRLGQKQADGTYTVTYGALFNDEKVANTFEALLGTLKAAKRQKVINFQGEMLLQGVHNNVVITLLQA